MKVRLTVQLWVAVAVVVGVVVMADGRVKQREIQPTVVSPLVPGKNLTAARSHPLAPQLNRQSWTSRNIYPGHYPEEEPDKNANYWARRARGRYYSSGASPEGSLYTERVTTARHESREPQPRRVYTTYSTAGNAVSRDSLTTARSRTSAGERFTSRVRQVDPPASTDNRRRYPHAQGSHEARVQSVPRGDMPQRPQPDRRISNHYGASSSYGNTRETSNHSRPLEGHPHSRHRVHDTHPRSGFRADLSMVTSATRDFPEGLSVAENHRGVQNTFSETRDEVENEVRQRVNQPDLCCGSRVPLDPRVALATGAFQRVAPAGSIKVVEVPAQHSFPPNQVRDLKAAPVDPNTLSLTWTAPGEDLDSGTVSGYIIRLSEEQHDLQESHFDAAPEETLLETSESLAAAGVYQTAGTLVVAEVPLGRQLERGHVYYVALKALDNDGHSSDVSNMARFSLPESLTVDNTAHHHHATAEHSVQQEPRLEDHPDAISSRETAKRHREMTYMTPSPRGTDTARVEAEAPSSGNSEEQSPLSTLPPLDPEAVEPDGPGQQKKRNGKKTRRRKKNKSKRRRNERRRNGRRRDIERQGRGSDTSTQEPEVCEPSEQEQLESISLCDARYSLALAITYFTQNNEHQYLDYLSAALHKLEQKIQPSWRRESRVRRNSGGRRGVSTIKFIQNP